MHGSALESVHVMKKRLALEAAMIDLLIDNYAQLEDDTETASYLVL